MQHVVAFLALALMLSSCACPFCSRCLGTVLEKTSLAARLLPDVILHLACPRLIFSIYAVKLEFGETGDIVLYCLTVIAWSLYAYM